VLNTRKHRIIGMTAPSIPAMMAALPIQME
jgi:hypothetical protein